VSEDGCVLPEALYYWVEKHVWVRPEEDGTVVVGMTDVAQSLAGKIIVVNLRALGKELARGRSAGTLESGKWVGSIPSPVSGEVVAVNEALRERPSLVNSDPYGTGWLLRLRPSSWADEVRELCHGPEGVARYREHLQAAGITCRQG
jgi:glycine cleavage system H protein